MRLSAIPQHTHTHTHTHTHHAQVITGSSVTAFTSAAPAVNHHHSLPAISNCDIPTTSATSSSPLHHPSLQPRQLSGPATTLSLSSFGPLSSVHPHSLAPLSLPPSLQPPHGNFPASASSNLHGNTQSEDALAAPAIGGCTRTLSPLYVKMWGKVGTLNSINSPPPHLRLSQGQLPSPQGLPSHQLLSHHEGPGSPQANHPTSSGGAAAGRAGPFASPSSLSRPFGESGSGSAGPLGSGSGPSGSAPAKLTLAESLYLHRQKGLTEDRQKGLTENRQRSLTEERQRSLTEDRRRSLTEERQRSLTGVARAGLSNAPVSSPQVASSEVSHCPVGLVGSLSLTPSLFPSHLLCSSSCPPFSSPLPHHAAPLF
jgi:hypothetical protein